MQRTSTRAKVSLLPWVTMLLLSVLAWIPTLQQALGMYVHAMPSLGTMGLSLGPFLLFWTLMMAAMMFPALAPTIAARYQRQFQQTGSISAFLHMLIFLLGYLLIWTLCGVPAFSLAWLGEQFVLHSPSLAIGLGILLLLLIGCYQMSPWEKRFLRHCNPILCNEAEQSSCKGIEHSAAHFLSFQFEEGLTHGLHCLGCCGGLMLVMDVVGLMNLPWMILLSIVIFLEKTWHQGARFSFYVGFGLLIFAALALAEPALLGGLYRPV